MILPLLINTFISLPNRQLSIRIATLKYGLSTEAILNEIKYQSHTVLKCPLTSIGPSSDQHTIVKTVHNYSAITFKGLHSSFVS